MKPEISTAVMIERLRVLASESQDGVLLSSAVSRIELLLAAESGMSREMARIRHALDIPPDQSVQSGVVDAFVRLNAEILELRNQLAELRGQKPIGYVAKDAVIRIHEERSRFCSLFATASGRSVIPVYLDPVPPAASQLESDVLAVVGLLENGEWAEHCTKSEIGQRLEKAVTELHNRNGAASQPVSNWKDEFAGACLTLATITELLDIPADDVNGEPGQIFDAIEALKQRVSQPCAVPDERAAYETFIAKRLGDSIDTQRARNGDPEKPDYMAWDMTVGWIAWQGRAAMLQSGNSPVSPDSSVPEGYALVPDGYALVSIDLLNNFPEINICNYNHDDVRELNSWGIELVLSTDQKPISKDGDA